MTKMLTAKAVDRMAGWVTLARMVLEGPVLKKRQKTARKIHNHASGKGQQSMRIMNRTDNRIPAAETTKYAPRMWLRALSAAIPPRRVAVRPATATIMPKNALAE